MVTAPTADELYASAANFAQSALEAHHKGDHQRVAIDAGTALEHLTKACLVNRSPALLTELTGPNNWASLLMLCGLPEGRPGQLRTVGLREARRRAKSFFTSGASEADLDLLINLRDGVIHAAVNDEVEERLLVAFVQQADATLADMSRPRADFWADRLEVVDALLADASDKVTHRVGVKVEQAKAAFRDIYAEMAPGIRKVIVTTLEPRVDEIDAANTECPACGSQGVARGKYWVDEAVDYDKETGEPWVWGMVKFTPDDFSCQLCGLRLTTQAELIAAGMPAGWDVPDVEVADFDEYQHREQEAFEAFRGSERIGRMTYRDSQ